MFELIDILIVRPIVNILFIIYGGVGDFGFAIILFTVLVKICMWPLIKRQLHQAKLMRKIQPELAEIKKNCKGNRQLESLQMMDLYKRNNIRPFRQILTLIVQLPIFIALFTAVRAMAVPQPDNNLNTRAYSFVREIPRVEEVAGMQTTYLDGLTKASEENASKDEGEEKVPAPEYEFAPKLFGLVDLSSRPGINSVSSFVILLFALASALTQYLVSRQQLPSKKSKNSRTFRQILREASDGKEPDQSELNAVMTKQMSTMMPLMMLLVMLNLPGALVFYYLISNLFTVVQQKIVLSRSESEMEIAADKQIIRELNKIEEGQIISKDATTKSGAKVTRISAKSKHHKRMKKNKE